MIDKGMKGGNMEKNMGKNMKKVLTLSILGMFVLMFASSFVAAAVDNPITDPVWVAWVQSFFKLGVTWADFIIAIAVLVMIFAAGYDIMEFTAFKSKQVKLAIAGSIAAVTAVSGGVNKFAGFMMGIAGGSIAIATTTVIIIAVGFFVAGSFMKGQLRHLMNKGKILKAKDAFALAQTKTTADVKAAQAAAGAVE